MRLMFVVALTTMVGVVAVPQTPRRISPAANSVPRKMALLIGNAAYGSQAAPAPVNPGTALSQAGAAQNPERGRIPLGTARCPASTLLADWAGEPMASLSQVISVSLSFKPDGTYNYV